MSYNGGIDYGLLGDYDALPDIDLIAEGIDASLQELLQAARGTARADAGGAREHRPRAPNGGPTPIIPARHARADRGPAADMRAKRSRGDRPERKRPEH